MRTHTHTCMGALRGDGLAAVPLSVKWQTRIACWRGEKISVLVVFCGEQVFRN